MMIKRFVVALQAAGLELTARDIAELLWLVDQLGPDVPKRAWSEEKGAKPPGSLPPKPPDDQPPSPSPIKPNSAVPEMMHLHALERDTSGTGAAQARTPAAPPLPGAAAIALALRPLKRRVPSRTLVELDEEATVQAFAKAGILVPALRPAIERWLDLTLVIEKSASMRIWSTVTGQFKRMLENQGLFRDVRTYRLVARQHHADLFPGTGRATLSASPRRLARKSGRSAIVILSDALADGWNSGVIAELLRDWSRTESVMLIQLLPEHLWPGTAIGPTRVLFSAREPAVPNVKLARRYTRTPRVAPGAPLPPPLPVTMLQEWSIAPWAEMLAGRRDAKVAGVFLAPTASNETTDDRDDTFKALDAVVEFQHAASAPAYRLATCLASAPLTLPIMLLIQRVMLPGSRQSHLAEVFLSGLIEERATTVGELKSQEIAEARQDDEILYDFREGVRDILIAASPADQARKVLNAASAYVEGRTGIATMTTLIPSSDGQEATLSPLSKAFAEVARTVLGHIGPARESRSPRICVAGTGSWIPETQRALCSELGRRMAADGYHLVTGGWPGVDEAVLHAFVRELDQNGGDAAERVTQFVDPSGGATYKVGRIIETPNTGSFESVRYSDGGILVGGLGGTFEIFKDLCNQGKPSLPFAETGNDARKAYGELLKANRLKRKLDRGALSFMTATISPNVQAAATVDGALALLRLLFDAQTRARYTAYHGALVDIICSEPSSDIRTWPHLRIPAFREMLRDFLEAANPDLDLPLNFDPLKLGGGNVIPARTPDQKPRPVLDGLVRIYEDEDNLGRWFFSTYARLASLALIWRRSKEVRMAILARLAADNFDRFASFINNGIENRPRDEVRDLIADVRTNYPGIIGDDEDAILAGKSQKNFGMNRRQQLDLVLADARAYLRPVPMDEWNRSGARLFRALRMNLLLTNAENQVLLLLSNDPAERVVGYFAFQINPEPEVIKILAGNLNIERQLMIDERETRPLWLVLDHVAKLLGRPQLQGRIDSVASDVLEIQEYLATHHDVDPGHECRVAAENISAEIAERRDVSRLEAEFPSAPFAVLWVDDEPNNNTYLRERLEEAGIEFFLSRSTETALKMLSRYRFDAIISDMGRVDDPQAGYTLFDEVTKRGIATPFLIFASHGSAPSNKAIASKKGALLSTDIETEVEVALLRLKAEKDKNSRLSVQR